MTFFKKALISCLVFLLSFTSVKSLDLSKHQLSDHARKSQVSNLLNDKLITYFLEQNKYQLDNLSNQHEYGGSFIDSNGDLHFQVKSSDFINDFDSNYNIENIVSNTENVKVFFENVLYSSVEIESVINQIINSKLFLDRIIIEVYIDYTINGIKIVYDYSIIQLNQLEKNLVSNNIDFRNFMFIQSQSNYSVNEHISVYGGDRIVIGITGITGCTAGFVAKDISNNLGLLTAGHCTYMDDPVKKGTTEIGVVTKQVNEPSIDAAFVKLNSNTTAPKEGRFPPYISKTYTSASTTLPVQGSTLFMYGSTSGYHETTLTSNNASFSGWTNMLKYPQISKPGDSGGIVIVGTLAVGINRGGTEFTGAQIPFGSSYATPSKIIMSRFSLKN